MEAYNWVKLQRKIITYLITWDVGDFLLHPHILGIFLENVHLEQINSISEIQSISCLWVFAIFIYGSTWKIKCMQWLYSGNLINPCKCTYPKKMPEMCGWRRTTFPTSHVIRYVNIFLCNFTQFQAAAQRGVLLSICRSGAGLSVVAIARRRAAGDT